ncbi:unnamed protein product, partial [marine sediment metagenome]
MKKFLNNFYFYKLTREKYHLLKYKYNSALWKYINHEYIKGITLLNKSSYPFKDVTINIKNKKISDALNIVRNFKQEQYIVEIPSKSFIEPEFGWIITGPNYLLINSLPYCTDESANKEKNFLKKEIFNEMLSVKWHIVCKHATGLGLWTWKTFHNSPLRNYKVV